MRQSPGSVTQQQIDNKARLIQNGPLLSHCMPMAIGRRYHTKLQKAFSQHALFGNKTGRMQVGDSHFLVKNSALYTLKLVGNCHALVQTLAHGSASGSHVAGLEGCQQAEACIQHTCAQTSVVLLCCTLNIPTASSERLIRRTSGRAYRACRLCHSCDALLEGPG